MAPDRNQNKPPTPRIGWRAAVGLGRSLAIYYGQPAKTRALVALYKTLLPPGARAFDIGAHVGNRSRALRRAGARVVAVEPQAPFTGFLRRTLPRDIALVEAAVGARAAVAEMAVSRLHPTVSSLTPDFATAAGRLPGVGLVAWDQRQPVTVTTLDALAEIHGQPDFIKIDVEGFEAEVLAGLSRPAPLIAFEYLPGLPDVTRAALARLTALGRYHFNVVEGERHRLLWPEWRDADAARAWLSALPPTAPSGDLYARRADAPLPAAAP